MPLWGFVISFICATLWAASPIMADRGVALSRCTANEINPIRSFMFLILSFAAALVVGGGHIPLVTSPKAYAFIFGGVFVSYMFGDVFYFMSIRILGISIAVPVANAYPMLVTLTSWLLLGEPITLTVFIGVTTVVAGLLFLRLGVPKSDTAAERSLMPKGKKLVKGFVLAIAAGCCWALGAPMTKLSIVYSGLGAVDITFYRSVAFFILAWGSRYALQCMNPASTVPLRTLPRAGWIYMSASGAIGLCIGSILYAACIEVMPVAIVTAITATSPFMAALFGHFVLKQKLFPLQWCGVIMIIAGSVVVSL